MGYLTDNISIRSGGAICTDLYPFAMIVRYALNDPFTAPNAVDTMSLAIKEVIPDVEEWQVSVLRDDRVKFRFHTEAQRNQASNALNTIDVEIQVKKIAFQNPPDSTARGIA